MTSGVLASVLALFAWSFIEALRRFYPAHELWWRWRRLRGREAVRRMRERFEAAAKRPLPRIAALVLVAVVVGWLLSAPMLHKRWYLVVLDVLPSLIVAIGILRVPGTLRRIAERMRDYERDAGEDP